MALCSNYRADSSQEGFNQHRHNDLFRKCINYTRPQELQEVGLYTYFQMLGQREDCNPGEVWMNKQKVLMFGSNDYLDFVSHPMIKETAQNAIQKYGTGCSGSRLLNGTLDLHIRLEEELAAFMGKESALIFGSGFQANFASLTALADKGDILLCDKMLHASIVEACLRSKARTMRFLHNDMKSLARFLHGCPNDTGVLLVSEGVFSMEGDIARIPEMVKLAKENKVRLYIDEAHGIGVLGPTGAGAAEELGSLPDVDIVMGTFSKSLASVGGFVAAPKVVISYIKHISRPFVFSASLPAACVATVLTALSLIREAPETRKRLLYISNLLREELRSRNFPVLEGRTPVIPIVINDERDVCRLCKELLNEGIYVNPVLKPFSSMNLIRISCTAAHTESQIGRLVETLVKLAKPMGIIG